MANRPNPLTEFERMIERMSDQVDRNFVDWPPGSQASVDVVEHDDEYVVRADLPGFDSDDVTVELRDDTLHISAERDEETETDDERYVRRERRHESVERAVRVPGAVVESEVTAAVNDGVLTVRLPKADGDGGSHRIDIE